MAPHSGTLAWKIPWAEEPGRLQSMGSLSRTRLSKKRWQQYTEELYKKDLHDLDNHDGVITHLEPDILECEVTGPSEASL